MTDILFTDEWCGISSAVDEALYDADTKTFYITLDGGASYSYDNVDTDTWNKFVGSWSKGRFYAKTIKGNYGPGTYLGYNVLEDAEERGTEAPDMGPITTVTGPTTWLSGSTTTVGTPKDLTYAVDAVVDGQPAVPAKVFDLTSPDPGTPLNLHTVVFSTNGSDERSYSTRAASVDDALDQLNEIGEMLDITFTAKSVTVHFE